jgi:hypothetical protein
MVNSWPRSWRLSTPKVTGSHQMSLRDRTAGKKYHRLTPEWIRLLTRGVIGMMVTYNTQSWRLCYIARHLLPLQSIASGLKKHNLFVVSSAVQLLISTQLGCPALADIILPGISCTFVWHIKSRYVCALRTTYSLAQWSKVYILSLHYAVSYSTCMSLMFSRIWGCFAVHSSSTSKRQTMSPSTWIWTSKHRWMLEILQTMWCWMTYRG